MKVEIKASKEEMISLMDDTLEKMMACWEAAEAWPEETQSSREQMESEISSDFEQINATESKANQEKTEAVMEHQKVPNKEATVEIIRALIYGPGTSCGYHNWRKR
jgi:hypothetical protein